MFSSKSGGGGVVVVRLAMSAIVPLGSVAARAPARRGAAFLPGPRPAFHGAAVGHAEGRACDLLRQADGVGLAGLDDLAVADAVDPVTDTRPAAGHIPAHGGLGL